MSAGAERIFRAAAIERASSPEQLDQLVRIVRPFDWIVALVIVSTIAAVFVWSIIGRIPTRVSGQGILVSAGGRVLDAVSAATGRLASIDVAVGDHVSQGQVVARISQTEIEERYRAALQVAREREREHTDLVASIDRELAMKSRNFATLEVAFKQAIQATEQRIQYLALEVNQLEQLFSKGLTTRPHLEDVRQDLAQAQQRKTDTENEILKLRAQKADLETQRDHDRQTSQFRVNEAHREIDRLAGQLGQDSQVVSPIDGRVIEAKVSGGSVLSVGTPVLAIESDGPALDAVVYIPGDRGKSVRPGMEVRVEPSTVKREEYGTLVGTVVTISDFPMTPQGMTAVLHNETLVSRFSHDGAPYAAVVRLQQDGAVPSGYHWSVGRGPLAQLTAGTLVRAETTTKRQRPIELVLPTIKRLTGIAG
jgi:HlyD family secretion protein